MSLLEENDDGLLGTQVTWEDVQRDCYRLWGPDAKLGPNKTFRDIADGKGFLSRIGVVENTWESPEQAERNGWPRKFVVKIVTFLQEMKYIKELEKSTGKKCYNEEEMKQQIEKYNRLHNTECQLYEKFKECGELSKLQVYVSHPFTEQNPDKGYLIMEYVEDIVNMGNETYLEEKLVDQVLDALAWYHSMGLNFTEEEKKQYTRGIVTDFFGTMLQPNFVETFLDTLSSILGEEERDTYEKYRKSIEVLVAVENTRKMDKMAEILGMRKALCHGDPWTCNIICTEKDGVKKLHALIDYQTSHFGCVGHDLARLFVNVLTYDERIKNIGRYIHNYWSRIAEIWKTKGKELPFTEEQLATSYKSYLPLASYAAGVSTAGLMEIRCKNVGNPEIAKEIMKKKIAYLGKTFEESLPYLASI